MNFPDIKKTQFDSSYSGEYTQAETISSFMINYGNPSCEFAACTIMTAPTVCDVNTAAPSYFKIE